MPIPTASVLRTGLDPTDVLRTGLDPASGRIAGAGAEALVDGL